MQHGGILILELPNIKEIFKMFPHVPKDQKYGLLNCIYGIAKEHTPHLWGWYEENITDILQQAGFSQIKVLPIQFPHPGPNFRIEAIKE
jgi:hypothetical protein